MTQPDLFSAPSLAHLLGRRSLCAVLANYLIARRGKWVDGRDLARIGGYAGWRTRVSNLRKAPWHLVIENRWFVTRVEGGRQVRVTEYRLV